MSFPPVTDPSPTWVQKRPLDRRSDWPWRIDEVLYTVNGRLIKWACRQATTASYLAGRSPHACDVGCGKRARARHPTCAMNEQTCWSCDDISEVFSNPLSMSPPPQLSILGGGGGGGGFDVSQPPSFIRLLRLVFVLTCADPSTKIGMVDWGRSDGLVFNTWMCLVAADGKGSKTIASEIRILHRHTSPGVGVFTVKTALFYL